MPHGLFEPAASRLILVEGREEELFVNQLAKHLALASHQIKSYEGKDNLGSVLKALASTSAFRRIVTSLAIIRDADANAENAFRSVADAVSRARLQPPTKSGTKGTGRPAVSIFIMPDGSRPGMLEDLCLESVSDQPVMNCVDRLFDCVREVGERPPGNMAKAKVYAYLATRPQPGRRIGETAGSGTWPFDAPAFEPLCRFLKSL